MAAVDYLILNLNLLLKAINRTHRNTSGDEAVDSNANEFVKA